MYTCEWERPDSPTKAMSQSQMIAYYKGESVHSDCRFYLETQTGMPLDLRVAFCELFEATASKTKPEHRKRLAVLKNAWRQAMAGEIRINEAGFWRDCQTYNRQAAGKAA